MTVSIGLGRVQIFPLVVGWAGLGQSADGLGWVTRSRPMDNSAPSPAPAAVLLHLHATAPLSVSSAAVHARPSPVVAVPSAFPAAAAVSAAAVSD